MRERPENIDRVLSKPPRLAELRSALAELTNAGAPSVAVGTSAAVGTGTAVGAGAAQGKVPYSARQKQ